MMKVISGCVLFIGFVSLVAFGLDKMDAIKSASWPTVSGKLLEIKDKKVGMPIIGRFAPIRIPYAKYSYTVAGKTYIGEKTAGPCLLFVRMATFKEPEMIVPDTTAIVNEFKQSKGKDISKLMESVAKVAEHLEYKPIKVYYQPDHPENSALDPGVLQSGIAMWWTSILLITVGGLVLGALYYHEYITSPVTDDPTLSLEHALKTQRRYR